MKYLDTEGTYNPDIEPAVIALPDFATENWGSLLGEAKLAIRITLDELALLAGIVTAETTTLSLTHVQASPDQSVYSLLIEPSLLKFPS